MLAPGALPCVVNARPAPLRSLLLRLVDPRRRGTPHPTTSGSTSRAAHGHRYPGCSRYSPRASRRRGRPRAGRPGNWLSPWHESQRCRAPSRAGASGNCVHGHACRPASHLPCGVGTLSVRAGPPCQARPRGGKSAFGRSVLWVTAVSIAPVRVYRRVSRRVFRCGRIAVRRVTRRVVLSVTVPVIGLSRAGLVRLASLGRGPEVAGTLRRRQAAGNRRRVVPVAISVLGRAARCCGRRVLLSVAIAGRGGGAVVAGRWGLVAVGRHVAAVWVARRRGCGRTSGLRGGGTGRSIRSRRRVGVPAGQRVGPVRTTVIHAVLRRRMLRGGRRSGPPPAARLVGGRALGDRAPGGRALRSRVLRSRVLAGTVRGRWLCRGWRGVLGRRVLGLRVLRFRILRFRILGRRVLRLRVLGRGVLGGWVLRRG